MVTTSHWVLDPVSPQPGHPGPIAIVNIEDAPISWPVCVIPGNIGWQSPRGAIVQLLHEEDIAAARVIAAAPSMLRALEALVHWARDTGGWDADCWREAERVLVEAGRTKVLATGP